MSPDEKTLRILEEIEALVSDKLQVSYKWLSRNFLVPSNAAKRLLQEFIETRRSAIEVVYALSGWSKKNPSSYHVKLVSGSKLEEAKQEFDGNCSVQVYSVQACIPKDPGELWNAEFVQAEELFKQPSLLDNCLRNNRFCGILNSFVNRIVDGTPVTIANPQPKSAEVSGSSRSNSAHQSIANPPSPQIKGLQSGSDACPKSPSVIKDIKTVISGAGGATKPPAEKEKIPQFTANKTKGQHGKSSAVNGGSLANLWGLASSKSKPTTAAAEDNKLNLDPTASAEAQIFARELVENGSSDDEARDVNFKRASNGEGSRKRRVVFDFSDDECEDAVNLASPDLPKGPSGKSFLSEKADSRDQTEDKAKVKEKELTDGSSNQLLKKDSSASSKITDPKTSSSEKIHDQITGDVKKDSNSNASPSSPKRRKVLKTRIDERGREVTEVVWEGEDTATKKEDSNTTKKTENSGATNSNHRGPAAKKSPAYGNVAQANPSSKAANKKGGHKDPKQGNILSFFKKI